ncbi:ECF-type sigma factor [Edaphovirga cremea]|uniref:ECF-type sigma factor n=1 Tax=Edaphovirga cremea TaxID=2267246 RepID=UPI000DEF7040|nr:ECF-type sigma factor [Edaphovirga cremea]
MSGFFYHLYRNVAEVEDQNLKSEIKDVRTALSISSERTLIDSQPSPNKSNSLKILINRGMGRGDDLVVLDLNSLGSNAEEIQENIIRCAKKAIRIHCYFPQKKLTSTADGYIFTLLLPKIQNECRKVDLAALKKRNITKPLGRREGSEYREGIELAKCRGLTQSQTAKELEISISTVKRNWNKGIIG